MAVTSETDICNLALGHLGEAPIESMDEDNLAARACALHYATTRDEVLRSHRWNFATRRAELSRLDDTPAFGWSYQYPLPTDCLRVVEFNDTELGDVVSDEFLIEGRNILTDSETAQIVYVRTETDVTKYDALFVKALALRLAVELSETIRGATSKTEQLTTAYERITGPLARRVDANEGRRRKGLLSVSSMAVRARSEGV